MRLEVEADSRLPWEEPASALGSRRGWLSRGTAGTEEPPAPLVLSKGKGLSLPKIRRRWTPATQPETSRLTPKRKEIKSPWQGGPEGKHEVPVGAFAPRKTGCTAERGVSAGKAAGSGRYPLCRSGTGTGAQVCCRPQGAEKQNLYFPEHRCFPKYAFPVGGHGGMLKSCLKLPAAGAGDAAVPAAGQTARRWHLPAGSGRSWVCS